MKNLILLLFCHFIPLLSFCQTPPIIHSFSMNLGGSASVYGGKDTPLAYDYASGGNYLVSYRLTYENIGVLATFATDNNQPDETSKGFYSNLFFLFTGRTEFRTENNATTNAYLIGGCVYLGKPNKKYTATIFLQGGKTQAIYPKQHITSYNPPPLFLFFIPLLGSPKTRVEHSETQGKGNAISVGANFDIAVNARWSFSFEGRRTVYWLKYNNIKETNYNYDTQETRISYRNYESKQTLLGLNIGLRYLLK